MLHDIIFQPFGAKTVVEDGQTILHAAQKAGVHIPAYCGGEKSCGKCRVKLTMGNFDKYRIKSATEHLSPVTDEEKKHFTQKELQSGYRLACMTEVRGDVVIDVPDESRMQTQIILETGKSKEISLNPGVKTYYVDLEQASLTDYRDDLLRVRDALKSYEELNENLQIDFSALKELPLAMREGGWKLTAYVLYGEKIIGFAPGKVTQYYGAAVDIGTTTVVVYLCDLSSGEVLATGSFMNPQMRYGDDVISRISYCMNNDNGLQIMHDLLIEELNKTLENLAQSKGLSIRDICETVLVFNTVMECMTLGVSPQSLGVSPFVSPVAEPLDIPSREVGFNMMAGGNVHCLPSEAGFVGADNVAVLIAEEPYLQEKVQLIIDIGTNSEICLGNKDRLYVTSCATGPALEGAQIKCGMRAAEGAIEAVKIDPVTLEPTLKIIGENEKPSLTPVGICGSGILDVVAQMALTGIIEPNGKFSKQAVSERIREGENGKKEYVLYTKKDHQEHDIVVTMADVRAVQLAKGALYAGAKTLMNRCGITAVDEVVLAGAFGSYIDRENALALGLFPDCNVKDIVVSGNAAGLGARLALCDTDKRAQAEKVARDVIFVETAAEEDYAKCFSEAMMIPHKTDAFTFNKPKAFSCPGRHSVEAKAPISEYLFKDIDAFLGKEESYVKDLVEKVIAENTRENLPKNVIDLPGPFAVLGYMISPVTLYSCAKKCRQSLDKALSLITENMVSYAKDAIDCGAKIISYADPAGELEHVGASFYRDFPGKYNQMFFTKIEPYLKEALIHICGKTSISMEKAGLMLSRPYRMDGSMDYLDVLFEEAKQRKVNYIGHACINMKRQPKPILCRMELTKVRS
jgi:uncharacterized 2Fe-2S/4Fe-4S cluster protein (DUF4445 family)